MNRLLIFISVLLCLQAEGQIITTPGIGGAGGGAGAGTGGGAIGTTTTYVTNFPGFDGNSGSIAAPVSTLERAYQLAGPGGVIELLRGDYTNMNFRATNRQVTISANGLVNIYNGSNCATFTLVSGSTYSFVVPASVWTSNDLAAAGGANIGGPYIYEWGTSQYFIPRTARNPLEYMHNFAQRNFYSLTNAKSLAALATAANSAYFPSNNADGSTTIFMKFSDAGVPGTRTVWMPSVQTTNSLVWGGAAGGRVTVAGIYVWFGRNGVDASGLDRFEDENCGYFGSYDSGATSSDMSATIIHKQTAAIGNNNDGFTYTTGGDRTNINAVFLFDCLSEFNGDEGISVHSGGPVSVFGGIARGNKNGGVTPYQGGRMTVYNMDIFDNAVGVAPGGDLTAINANWTNFTTTAYLKNCNIRGNNFGVYPEFSSPNILIDLVGCTLSNVVDFVIYPSQVNQTVRAFSCSVSRDGYYGGHNTFIPPFVADYIVIEGPTNSQTRGVSRMPKQVTADLSINSTFTNKVTGDVVISMGQAAAGHRTNSLPDAATMLGGYVTIFDAINCAGNAGSNIWFKTVSSQLINMGPTITNVSANNGSMTLRACSPQGVASWFIVERTPN